MADFDYNSVEAYSKLKPLVGKVVLFTQDHSFRPYVSARLSEVREFQLTNSEKHAINVTLLPPIAEFKDRPSVDDIRIVVSKYDQKSEKERQALYEQEEPLVGLFVKQLKLKEDLDKTPWWKIRERAKKRLSIMKDVNESASYLVKPLSEDDDKKPISVSYAQEVSRRVWSRDMVDSFAEVLI